MKALAARDPSQLKLAKDVRYAENDVLLPLGQGLWRTVTGVDATGLTAADPLTGNAAWFGSVRENGKPAIYAVRVHVNRPARSTRSRRWSTARLRCPRLSATSRRWSTTPSSTRSSRPSSAARASVC